MNFEIWRNQKIQLNDATTIITGDSHPMSSLNPKLLHNTPQKKQDRAKMIAGERPKGCEYCWKIEDIGRDAISDRVYKSKISLCFDNLPSIDETK